MYANETINEKQRIKIIHNKAFLKKIHRTMCDEKRYEKETCNPFSKAGATKEWETAAFSNTETNEAFKTNPKFNCKGTTFN